MRVGRRQWIRLGAAALLIVVIVGVAAFLALPSEPVESRYGYSVSLSTTATLQDVSLRFPIPATETNGAVVEAVSAGRAEAPAGWNVTIVDTDYGPMLQITADTIRAERQPDGRTYSTYGLSLAVHTDTEIDTKDPFDAEPLLRPRIDQRERPCPNQAVPDSDETCYSFGSRAFANYTAPAGADVDVYVVAGGTNDLTGPGRPFNRYYDRVTVFLDGPQSGWSEAEGFSSTGVGTYSRFGPLVGLPVAF